MSAAVKYQTHAGGPHADEAGASPASGAISTATLLDELTAESQSLLIPSDEPLSLGEPPVRPSVRRLSVGLPLRQMTTRSGVRVRSPMATKQRAAYEVEWGAIDCDEYEALLTFFGDDGSGTFGTLLAFDIDPDESGSIVSVRMTAEPVFELMMRNVYRVRPVQCEEVFT